MAEGHPSEQQAYTAVVDWIDGATPVGGCGCDWVGTAAECAPIEEACLTPGDPSPAGRCPKCGGLAYIEAQKILAGREVSSPLFAIRNTAREARDDPKCWWSGDGDDVPGEWVEEENAAWRNAPRGDLPEFGQWVARIEVFVGKYAYCPVESFDGEYL